MEISEITAASAASLVGAARVEAAPPKGFSSLVSQGLQKVNDQLQAGQTTLQNLATGDVQNLHQVMIQLEESRVAFQLMMQVRTRALEAYQDIMKMPI